MSDLDERRERLALVGRHYKDYTTDWCGHSLAVKLTAERLELSRDAVERELERLKQCEK